MTIGFKEWALVCRALESGRTSLILRKGGIAEGREGFCFKHARFFLFPTLFHEQTVKTTLPPETPLPAFEPGTITITARATVEWTRLVTDPAALEALAPWHILQRQVVLERFHYGDEGEAPGLHVAFLRVEKLSQPWTFPDSPRYGGCRSWVDLPDLPPEITGAPVLDDAANEALAGKLRAVLM